MANATKQLFLKELETRFGPLKKLSDSESLYEIQGTSTRVYVRYSRIHGRGQGFYGLRRTDLRSLEGHAAVLCFLWNGQTSPLLIPYSDYEQVFQTVAPADDGQYKVQVYPEKEGVELYVPRAGRFNVEAFVGWSGLQSVIETKTGNKIPELGHSQVQTLLASIGKRKGFDVWLPFIDRTKLDWSITTKFQCSELLPSGFDSLRSVVQEVDVIGMVKGSGRVSALYEIEHSTPIYSGLLRFNDMLLTAPEVRPRFSIVANDIRREAFVHQVNRPTFRRSGLNEVCSFLDYANVYYWHERTQKQKEP